MLGLCLYQEFPVTRCRGTGLSCGSKGRVPPIESTNITSSSTWFSPCSPRKIPNLFCSLYSWGWKAVLAGKFRKWNTREMEMEGKKKKKSRINKALSQVYGISPESLKASRPGEKEQMNTWAYCSIKSIYSLCIPMRMKDRSGPQIKKRSHFSSK